MDSSGLWDKERSFRISIENQGLRDESKSSLGMYRGEYRKRLAEGIPGARHFRRRKNRYGWRPWGTKGDLGIVRND